MNETGIRWTSKTTYVDIDTGEVLRQTDAQRYYIKIKTDKYVRFNKLKTKGTIEYTIRARKNPQLRCL